MTCVPEFGPVMSRVVPEGTAILLRTIVEHDFLLAEADAALVKVQEVALSSSLAGAVGAGAGTAPDKGNASAEEQAQRSCKAEHIERI